MSGTGPQGTPIAELVTVMRTSAVVDSPGATAKEASQGVRRGRATIRPGRKRSIRATATTGMAPGQDVVPGSSNAVCPADPLSPGRLWIVEDGQVLRAHRHFSRANRAEDADHDVGCRRRSLARAVYAGLVSRREVASRSARVRYSDPETSPDNCTI